MSVNDKILDEITGHSVDLQRLDASVRKKVLKQLKTLEADLVEELRRSTLWNARTTQTQQKRLKVLLEKTRETIKTAFSQIAKDNAKELQQVSSLAEAQVVKTLNVSLNMEVASVGMSASVLNAIAKDTVFEGATNKEWWSRRSETFRLKFQDTIRKGLVKGQTVDELITALIGRRVNRYLDGALRSEYRGAEALVRTGIQSVANQARLEAYNQYNDLIKGIEWVATLDNRTSQVCRGLDGLTWDLDRNPIGHKIKYPGTTAHWNCRSTQVPIVKSWKELGAKGKYNEIPESTRASMDGQVSEKVGYEDWLKRKSKSFQEDVLGKTKRKLWQEGKVGFTDLVDQSGNALTIDQIQNKLKT